MGVNQMLTVKCNKRYSNRRIGHAPGPSEVSPACQWDVIAKDFEDLASQLGC